MRLRFVWLSKRVDRDVGFPAPKKVEDLHAWLKQARKVLPEIPDPFVRPFPKWKIKSHQATPELVVFELETVGIDRHTKGYDFCHVVINRQASSLG